MGGGGYGGGGGGGRSNELGQGLRAIEWDLSKLSHFEKNFYHEHPAVTALTDSEIDAWRAKHQITLHGLNIPKPVLTFETSPFPGIHCH